MANVVYLLRINDYDEYGIEKASLNRQVLVDYLEKDLNCVHYRDNLWRLHLTRNFYRIYEIEEQLLE